MLKNQSERRLDKSMEVIEEQNENGLMFTKSTRISQLRSRQKLSSRHQHSNSQSIGNNFLPKMNSSSINDKSVNNISSQLNNTSSISGGMITQHSRNPSDAGKYTLQKLSQSAINNSNLILGQIQQSQFQQQQQQQQSQTQIQTQKFSYLNSGGTNNNNNVSQSKLRSNGFQYNDEIGYDLKQNLLQKSLLQQKSGTKQLLKQDSSNQSLRKTIYKKSEQKNKSMQSTSQLQNDEQESDSVVLNKRQSQQPSNRSTFGISGGGFDENCFKYSIDPSKHSSKKNGIIKAYAANTHHGLFRNYNEDRVSIILSISQPQSKKLDYWPKCSFFAVYDGHGGNFCADFLRDNLHLFIIRDENFPQNPIEAIKRGFHSAEQTFLKKAEELGDRSGSCAIVVLILDDDVYIANTGDSRAVLSLDGGKDHKNLSFDHKPQDEKERIMAAGGKVYQASIANLPMNFQFAGINIQTPFRVLPGKLSVSRTFGDKDAKLTKYGGNPKVVIPDPDIIHYKLSDQSDFIILACDGIFDRLETKDVIDVVWQSTKQYKKQDIHQQVGTSVEAIIKESFERKTLDNVTVVMIAFSNFKKSLFPKRTGSSSESKKSFTDKSQTSSKYEKLQNIKQNYLNTGKKEYLNQSNSNFSKAQNDDSKNRSTLNNSNQYNDSQSISNTLDTQNSNHTPIKHMIKAISSRVIPLESHLSLSIKRDNQKFTIATKSRSLRKLEKFHDQ